ncbi:phage protein Gp27 family protein [Methylococcus capsulatus]|uniref:phage protein Gp27 family protein n=1 Tax=Methylococcus capsulatus TaxID=414 RepID=UPI0031F2E287
MSNGFGGLEALSAWLGEQGYKISRSALGRHNISLKEAMDKAMDRARTRLECAKALKGMSDGDKAALLEANEMIALDKLMDLWDDWDAHEPEAKAELLPKLVRASADLNRSAVGTAKWKRDFEARIRAEERAKAADVATKAAKSQGVSPETIALIRRDVLGMAT